MKTILFLILIGLGVTACNSSRNIVKLTGVKWVLEKLDGKPLQMKENGNKVYIHFNDTERGQTEWRVAIVFSEAMN